MGEGKGVPSLPKTRKQRGGDKRGVRKITTNSSVGRPTPYKEKRILPRTLADEDIKEGRGAATRGGCRIMEVNADGRVGTNGMQIYLEEMERMKVDILIMVDTGIGENQIRNIEHQVDAWEVDLAVQIAPAYTAAPNDQGRCVGGIIIVATYPWAANLGTLHTDDSRLGLIGKIKLKTNESDILLIPTYLPPFRKNPTEPNSAVGKRLQQWLRKAQLHISPLQWLTKVLSKWVTIAHESGVLPCIIGDLNASNYPTEAGSTGAHGPLSALSAGWGMYSALDDTIPNYHTYWVNGDGVSRLDHFMVTAQLRPLVKWAGVDYSSVMHHMDYIVLMPSKSMPTQKRQGKIRNLNPRW